VNVAQIIPLADTWGMHGDVGWGWMALMMVLMVLFWGAVIFGIVWLIRGVARGGPAPSGETPVSRETAVQILERRFAEGALTVEDYRARREVLVNGTAEPTGASKEEPQAASQAGEGGQ
jgi:putative membrane protein